MLVTGGLHAAQSQRSAVTCSVTRVNSRQTRAAVKTFELFIMESGQLEMGVCSSPMELEEL